jgi:hypothetical protein
MFYFPEKLKKLMQINKILRIISAKHINIQSFISNETKISHLK